MEDLDKIKSEGKKMNDKFILTKKLEKIENQESLIEEIEERKKIKNSKRVQKQLKRKILSGELDEDEDENENENENDGEDDDENGEEEEEENGNKSKKIKISNNEVQEAAKQIEVILSVVAKPLADPTLCALLFKFVKEAHSTKGLICGVRAVAKAIRTGKQGLVILAGNVSPIDVISHVPVLCEDKSIPYIFVPSREVLGSAAFTKRSAAALMVDIGKISEENAKLASTCISKVKKLH
eukprot:TRINITY_DN628_c1_g1_i7.p1 TRINITY_DN628_c1_g1~~TRINITY_DN628_c1_g1_i7.p1  ORF type:complete len:239 (+),score=144.82 TRINITY_DN628_c1_g1_i7:211-927(+)